MSLNNAKLSSDLLSFTSGYIGGEMDESSTFKVADYESGELRKKMDSYSPTDTTLQDWKRWFLESKTDQFNSHKSSLSEADYVKFLKKQNTKQSLEAALLISPKDPETLKLYGEELTNRAEASGLNPKLKSALQKRAKWYLDRAASLN